jgi:sarcosine oxidase subunit alpha
VSGWRLPEGGTAIDRARPLRFSFDGAPLAGFEGDTLASALLAAGVGVIGRSFKYHRPRGLWGGWGEEPNALFDVTEAGATTPNVRGTMTRLRDGMALRAVNASPSAARDRARWIDLAARFLPAGFYYKTFIAGGWMRWEPMIRAMAGLGRLDPGHAPAAENPQFNAACDLLVIGAGPAGLAAAGAAARAGRAVWLLDDQDAPGGSLRWRGGAIEGGDWRDWTAAQLDAVRAAGGRVMASTTAVGVHDHGLVTAWERRDGPDAWWRIRPAETVLAAGAVERPLAFANNDRPGVMSADAALRHLTLYAAAPGREIVVAATNDSAYPAAEALAAAGCAVTVVDARADSPAMAATALRVEREAQVSAVEGRSGVEAVSVGGRSRRADAVLVSGGWTPTVHLFMQARGRLRWRDDLAALVPDRGPEGFRVAGAANGAFTLADALAEGWAAGGGAGASPAAAAGSYDIRPLWPDPTAKGRRWVDLQNDVTVKDVALAAREGFTSVEHLKRYTTLGMATDQGRTANLPGLATMAGLTGRSIPETGTTTYRPPFTPTPLTVIAGRRRGALFNPLRRLPLEAAHREAGARFREYGGWLRPAVHGAGNEADRVQAEARMAREAVALLDGSPLGKIEVMGPDAAALVDFNSYNRLSTLKPGRARYGFMLTEAGVVYDDGVTLRLGEDRFLVSCSSGHVEGVRLRLEEIRQDRLSPRRAAIHDVTAHWATLTVTGPRARDLLRAAGIALDLDDAALAHMAVAEGRFEDGPLRVARVSFTGDRSYELSVPARRAEALRARLAARLPAFGGGWIGLEALLILRAEKGFILVGKDTDGLTMPHDLGWPAPREKRADEYFGRRSLFTPEASREDRKQLVGLAIDGTEPLPTGAHLVPAEGPRRSLGYVTSSYASPTLGRPVALCLLERGRARMGETVSAFHLGETRAATVCAPCALDPEGARLHG